MLSVAVTVLTGNCKTERKLCLVNNKRCNLFTFCFDADIIQTHIHPACCCGFVKPIEIIRHITEQSIEDSRFINTHLFEERIGRCISEAFSFNKRIDSKVSLSVCSLVKRQLIYIYSEYSRSSDTIILCQVYNNVLKSTIDQLIVALKPVSSGCRCSFSQFCSCRGLLRHTLFKVFHQQFITVCQVNT